MTKMVSVIIDKEQQELLKNLLAARREKNVSRIFREALWCYGEKILSKNLPVGATSYCTGNNPEREEG